MSYIKNLTYKKRRPSTRYLTPTEAIAKANTIAAEADAKIAEIAGKAAHIEQVAAQALDEVLAENAALREYATGLEAEVERLKRELEQAQRLTVTKVGKRKRRVRFDDEEFD